MSSRGLYLPTGSDSCQGHEERDGAFGNDNASHGANRLVERPLQTTDRDPQDLASLSNSTPSRLNQSLDTSKQVVYSALQVLDEDQPQVHRLTCVCCKCILQEPVQTEDGIRLCKCCAENIRKLQDHTCPDCKITVTDKDALVPDRAVRREVLALGVYCTLRSSGCQWTGIFKTFKEHLEGCEYKSIPCKLCKEPVIKKIMEEHLQEKCTQREIQCPHCARNLKSCELETHHDNDCPSIPIPCQMCKKQVKRELLRAHMENDCSHKECKICKEKVLREEFEKHMEQASGQHIEFLAKKVMEVEKVVVTKGSDERDGRHAPGAQVCRQDFENLQKELDILKASLDEAQAANRNLQEDYQEKLQTNIACLNLRIEELEKWQQQQRSHERSPKVHQSFDHCSMSGGTNYFGTTYNSRTEETSTRAKTQKEEVDAASFAEMKASNRRMQEDFAKMQKNFAEMKTSNRRIQEDFAEMKTSNRRIKELYDNEKKKNELLHQTIEELEKQQQQCSRAGSPALQQNFSGNTFNSGNSSFGQTFHYMGDSPTLSLKSEYPSMSSMDSELTGLIKSNGQRITILEKAFKVMERPPTITHPIGAAPEVVTMGEIAPYKQPMTCNPLIEKRIGELEHLVTSLSTQCTDMELQFQASLVSTFNGDFIWRIPDVSRRVRDAKTGKVTSIYSPPFYSSRMGYKMCIRAYMNGDGIGEKTHLSLFFVLMKGEFDALLTWPFQSSITLTLINQDNPGANVREVFRANPKSKSFQRPTTEMNVASGCPRFAALDYLTNPSYVKQDTLYIRCSVDTSCLVQL